MLTRIQEKNTEDKAINLVLEFSIGKVPDTIQHMVRFLFVCFFFSFFLDSFTDQRLTWITRSASTSLQYLWSAHEAALWEAFKDFFPVQSPNIAFSIPQSPS